VQLQVIHNIYGILEMVDLIHPRDQGLIR
jgi:hypothetical protein